jgi:hypothetical protein
MILCCATHVLAIWSRLMLLQEPSQGVVEFGDAEDEPDYTHLAHKQQRRQQKDTVAAANTSKGSKHSKPQQQQPKPQLAQVKTGELTHAEPNVPAESRLQLFGPVAAAGVADDSSWRGLGLTEVLATHLEALNFQEPTQVRSRPGLCVCVDCPVVVVDELGPAQQRNLPKLHT